MNINDLTITSLETIDGFDITTGAYLFTLDELQDATIQNSQDTQEITGKGGRRLANLKRNKSVTISGNNGMISGGLLEMQTGGTFENKATEVSWTDYLTVNASHAATTSWVAIGTAGAEITDVFVRNADGTRGDSLEQDTTAAAGKFSYAPATKTLQFHTDIAEGTEVVVHYKRKITADVLVNESDVYSKKCTLYVDALAEDKCANVYRVQFFIPKADFSGEFSIEMGDNQTVHAFEAESLAGACGAGSFLWTYTVFGVNTADTE